MKGLKACLFYFQILVVFNMKTSSLAAQAPDLPKPDSFWPVGTKATGSTERPILKNKEFYGDHAIDGRTETLWTE